MRSVLACVVAALVIEADWLRLEKPQHPAVAFVLVALALLPALAPRTWQRLAALGVAAVAAADVATTASVRHPLHLAGHTARLFWDGLLAFYDVHLPFDPAFRPEMHLVLLAATFLFVAALGLAARTPLAAVLVLLIGAGWPATLSPGGNDLLRGAAILAAAFLILAGLRRTTLRAAVAGAVLVAAALAAATQPAVAKDELLHWQQWDLYTRPPTPVGVRYVWDSQYAGFTWPKKITTVFKVKADARSVYWRATVLDEFDGEHWHEQLEPGRAELFGGKLDVTQDDPLLAPARRPGRWRKAEFDIRALADVHVPGPSGVAAFEPAPHDVRFERGGIAIVGGGLQRGDAYAVWSYEPQPTPRQLAASPQRYPAEAQRDLTLAYGASPSFARAAQRVAGDSRTPYAAALALESWFRTTGGFSYTQHPPRSAWTLAGFLRTKRGYCQHFAGAMAYMLRTLGIPARVAEGFTSGTYDSSTHTWTVTDHDAHAWVEAWFAGYGWLPFDPTPGRGALSAPYSVSSPSFRVASVSGIVGGVAASLLNTAALHQDLGFGEKGNGVLFGGTDIRHPKSGTGVGGAVTRRGGSLGRLLALVALAALALLSLVKLGRRHLRYATVDPRGQAAACRADLVDFLADQRIAVAPSATATELARVLRAELGVDARAFVDALSAARFGPPTLAHGSAVAARGELAALRARIRRRVGLVGRVRGFLSLRSLGLA